MGDGDRMKLIWNCLKGILVLSITFSQAQRVFAQAQGEPHFRTEVASLDETAQPSPDKAVPVTATATNGTPDPLVGATQTTTLAITEELDALKKRIEELEAELKSGTAKEPPTLAPTASAAPGNPRVRRRIRHKLLHRAFRHPLPLRHPTNYTPFAWGDFSWLNGTGRGTPAFDTSFFTPEIRFDTNYIESLNHPVDHTLGARPSRTGQAKFRSNKPVLAVTSTGTTSAAESSRCWRVCHHDTAKRR